MGVTERRRPTAHLSGRDLPRHLADAVVPNAAFLIGHEASGVQAGVIAALATGAVLVVARLMGRRRLTAVAIGFGVVVLHVATVLITGEGRDYFLPWLLVNVTATLVFLGSLLVGRPATARLSRFAGLTDHPGQHRRVTALWTGLWGLHLLVGLPLYALDHVVALGVAKFALGPPAILLWGLLTWRMLRAAPGSDDAAPTPS